MALLTHRGPESRQEKAEPMKINQRQAQALHNAHPGAMHSNGDTWAFVAVLPETEAVLVLSGSNDQYDTAHMLLGRAVIDIDASVCSAILEMR